MMIDTQQLWIIEKFKYKSLIIFFQYWRQREIISKKYFFGFKNLKTIFSPSQHQSLNPSGNFNTTYKWKARKQCFHNAKFYFCAVGGTNIQNLPFKQTRSRYSFLNSCPKKKKVAHFSTRRHFVTKLRTLTP